MAWESSKPPAPLDGHLLLEFHRRARIPRMPWPVVSSSVQAALRLRLARLVQLGKGAHMLKLVGLDMLMLAKFPSV